MPGLAHHLLMLYGPDIPNFFRRAVSYADKLRIRSATSTCKPRCCWHTVSKSPHRRWRSDCRRSTGIANMSLPGDLSATASICVWRYYRAAYFVDRILHGRLLATCRSSFRRDVFGGQFENRNRIGNYGAAGATHQTAGSDEAVNNYLSGWTAGAGVSVAFAQNWNVFAEYRYTSFGTRRSRCRCRSCRQLRQRTSAPLSLA